MAEIWSITDWDDSFENSRSRTMKTARWCAIPNRFDGDRMAELIGEGGDAVYAAWCAALLVASRCEPRGVLVRSNGKPHTPETLQRMTGITSKSFEKMLQLASTLGLMEGDKNVTGSCQDGDGSVSLNGRNGMEGMEGKNGTEEVAVDLFPAFWQAVPNKLGKGTARAAYAKAIKGGATHDEIMAGLPGYAASEARRKKQDGYMPLHPTTWLNAERWSDEPVSGSKAKAAAWDALGADVHSGLLEAVQTAEPDVLHSLTTDHTTTAMRKLARERGLI